MLRRHSNKDDCYFSNDNYFSNQFLSHPHLHNSIVILVDLHQIGEEWRNPIVLDGYLSGVFLVMFFGWLDGTGEMSHSDHQ